MMMIHSMSKMSVAALVVALLLVSTAMAVSAEDTNTLAQYSTDSAAVKVMVVTPANFDEVVMDPTRDVFVRFHVPWSGYCKAMLKVWHEIADAVAAGDMDVLLVDMDVEHTADKYDVTGFPTLRLYTKRNKKGITYVGHHWRKEMGDFLQRHISPY